MNSRLIAAAKKWGVETHLSGVQHPMAERPERDVAHELLGKLPQHLFYLYREPGRDSWHWETENEKANDGFHGFIDCVCELAERLEVPK